MLLNGKLIVSLIEVLPKEKTQIIGVAEIDLYPHFFSSSTVAAFKSWVTLQSAKNTDSSTNGELDVEITLSHPIMSAEGFPYP